MRVDSNQNGFGPICISGTFKCLGNELHTVPSNVEVLRFSEIQNKTVWALWIQERKGSCLTSWNRSHKIPSSTARSEMRRGYFTDTELGNATHQILKKQQKNRYIGPLQFYRVSLFFFFSFIFHFFSSLYFITLIFLNLLYFFYIYSFACLSYCSFTLTVNLQCI